MRTRSQPLSPGGLVALESEPRRTRSTRTATLRQGSAEPASQPTARSTRSASLRQPSAEPASQPATRSTRTASLGQPSAEPAPESSTRSTRRARTRQSSTEPSIQTTSRSRSRRTGNGVIASIEEAPTTQTRTRKTSTRRSTRQSTRKTSDDETEPIDAEQASQPESVVDETSAAQEPPRTQDSEPIPSIGEHALSEPKASDMNRKRPRDDTAETPSNKRRNVGPPGSTPFARRMTPLSRRITYNAAPYSERLRRRTIENQGRIHKTIFRLPQLLAQNEADRRAAESTPVQFLEPLQMNTESTEKQSKPDDQDPSDESPTAEPPSTPQASGWNIRGLINSVPRSFSRLLPRFGRSSRTSEAPAPSPNPQLSSELVLQPLVQEPRVSSSQPLPERPSHTKVVDLNQNATQSDKRSRRRLSEQPPSKRQRTLSYSLFPAPIDRARFLGDLTITPKKTSQAVQAESRPDDAEKPSGAQDQPPSASQATDVIEKRPLPQATEDATQKKRKRSASPDVIPNPAGCSYGLDLDYFCYSSDSEEEADVQPQQAVPPTKPDALAKSAVRSAIRSEQGPSKRVRFDASPEDTPSKLRTRPRATDPYTGRHFIGMGDAAQVTAPGSPAAAPATPTPAARVDLSTQRSPGFIPNKQGTFQLDYDAFSDDSESSGAPSPKTPSAKSVSETQTTATSTEVQESVQSPAARPTPRQALPPSTPARVDQEALARVRSQAEKYKPKTPSGLRTASRYSSPLTASPIVNQQPPVETFGDDDQFARDAQWLYEQCSTGDLQQLKWPEPNTLQKSLGVDDEIVRIVASVWDTSAVDEVHRAFHQSVEEFAKAQA